jgi:hypothetical protein
VIQGVLVEMPALQFVAYSEMWSVTVRGELSSRFRFGGGVGHPFRRDALVEVAAAIERAADAREAIESAGDAVGSAARANSTPTARTRAQVIRLYILRISGG